MGVKFGENGEDILEIISNLRLVAPGLNLLLHDLSHGGVIFHD
jgi:hypothetical protein